MTSLIILLWAYGTVINVSSCALQYGEICVFDLIMSFAFGLFFPMGIGIKSLVVFGPDLQRIVWRRK